MALHNSETNTTQASKSVYRLCRVCNLKGRKANPLVNCTKCLKHVHTNNSCSSNLNSSKNLNSNTADKSYLCNMCKVLKRMSSSSAAPTTQFSSRCCIQSNNTNSGRSSASQVTTPVPATQHINRRTLGSDSCPTTNKTKYNESTCNIPSHNNLQQQIDKIKSTLEEMQIQCTNNNILLNFLKQENQRLTRLVYNLQNAHYSSTPLRESSQQLSARTQGHCSIYSTRPSESSIHYQIN